MIKAIIFDFGNVMYRFDYNIFYTKIAQHSSKSVEEIRKIAYHTGHAEICTQFESGKINEATFLEHIKKACDLQVSDADFVEAFCEIYEPNQQILDLIVKLKPHYKLGFLSNTNPIHYKHKLKAFPIMQHFDAITTSFEVGHMKPHPKIYEDMLNKLGLRAQECIFIDDLAENAAGARTLGMYGIQFQNYPDLIQQLAILGVEVK